VREMLLAIGMSQPPQQPPAAQETLLGRKHSLEHSPNLCSCKSGRLLLILLLVDLEKNRSQSGLWQPFI